jgi:hypothetical protein
MAGCGAARPHYLLRLGYEPDDGCLRCVGHAVGYVPTSADVVETICRIAQRVRRLCLLAAVRAYNSVYKDCADHQFSRLPEAAVRAGVLQLRGRLLGS